MCILIFFLELNAFQPLVVTKIYETPHRPVKYFGTDKEGELYSAL